MKDAIYIVKDRNLNISTRLEIEVCSSTVERPNTNRKVTGSIPVILANLGGGGRLSAVSIFFNQGDPCTKTFPRE